MSKALTTRSDFTPAVALVVDGLTSGHSRRAYGRALDDFLTWWDGEGRPPLSKAIVQRQPEWGQTGRGQPGRGRPARGRPERCQAERGQPGRG